MLSLAEGDDVACVHVCFVPVLVCFGFHALQQESV